MINVTKTYLPPLEEYVTYLEKIWQSGWITNNGALVQELEHKLRDYLGVRNFSFVSNGTIALQIAIKALRLKGDIITTPFSYVATTSSIVWEGCRPVFVDIDPGTLTIDAEKIEQAITPRTSAIMATHVYGIPCDVERIGEIAKKHQLKVIYDAAHAFGVSYKGKSLLSYGDISTLSFHATKLFHTVEGGGIITANAALAHRISYLRNFGHRGEEAFWGLGINGKNSEMHAAMGLCLLPRLSEIIAKRRSICEAYDRCLFLEGLRLAKPRIPRGAEWNYSYYPVLFENESTLLQVRTSLQAVKIFPRRYFFPSLSDLKYVRSYRVQMAAEISRRVLCLPLYAGLAIDEVSRISDIIVACLRASDEKELPPKHGRSARKGAGHLQREVQVA